MPNFATLLFQAISQRHFARLGYLVACEKKFAKSIESFFQQALKRILAIRAARKLAMNRTKKAIVIIGIVVSLLLGTVISTTQAATTQSANRVFLGLSGYPTSTGQLDTIISTMQANGLNTYRMSANPVWSGGPHPYHEDFVQYFLDHTPSTWVIIVDRNHLYPPNEESAATARNNWDAARNSIFDVLEAYPNNQRVFVELINEYVSSDFYSRMQSLVTEIRSAGYTNPLIVNKWNQAWTVINDPLDNTYQGYHYYFNSWSPSGAISQLRTAQSKGIKLLNTETGADFNDNSAFTTSTVAELNQFLSQCASMGIGNTVWMYENLNNLPRYQQLNLDFPSVTSPMSEATPSPSPTSTPTPSPTVTPTPMPELSYPTQNWQRIWKTLEGQYLGQTYETALQFDNNWGRGTVAFSLADDIMFTSSRTISLVGGTYTFTVGSDDGFQLYIDNQLVMQNWVDRPYETNSYTTTLTSGSHKFRIDFYENDGNARASFAFQIQATTPDPTIPPTGVTFQDGFESGLTSDWTSTVTTFRDTVSIVGTNPYDGQYHASFYTSGSSSGRENAYLSKTTDLQDAYASAYFNIVGSVTGSRILSDNNDRFYILRFSDSSGNDIALAGIRREDGVNKWVLYAVNTYKTSAVSIQTDHWYNVELRWNAQQERAELIVDGVKILEIDVDTSRNTTVAKAEMGIIYTYKVQNPVLLYGDCFKLSS